MKTREVSVPELALVAGTRGMLGVGIGLLLAGRLARARRLQVGRTLLAIGAASTIPLAWRIFHTSGAAPTQADLPL
jgi:hypothetical protein